MQGGKKALMVDLFALGLITASNFSAPLIKLNRETKNVSRYVCNLRLMETSLNGERILVVNKPGAEKAYFPSSAAGGTLSKAL